jgi:hypothetical protein
MKSIKQVVAVVVVCTLTALVNAAEGDANVADEGPLISVDDLTLGYDEDGTVDEGDLAKAAQNPVADLVSLPFQNNFLFDTALGFTYNLNIQPVVPFRLSEDWNLISRTIVPVLGVENPPPGVDSWSLGDINATAFFSPANSKKIIWGVGPALVLPSATDSFYGSGKWSAGPSAVGLTIQGPWVIGALAQNVWSYAGWGDRSVNQMLTQPFINYNLKNGWYLVSAPIITADWNASGGEQWTVPMGGGVGKIHRIGKQPINLSFQGYYNVEHPTGGPEWSLRFQVQLLFPK